MTIVYKNINFGDHVHCNNCEKTMLVPCGTDICPECLADGCLSWVDENEPEKSAADIDEIELSDLQPTSTDGSAKSLQLQASERHRLALVSRVQPYCDLD